MSDTRTYPDRPQRPVVVRAEKSVGVTYLLWLLLGILGAHKFYLGRPGMGVLYLLTAGLLGVGLLVDLFTIPSQVRTANALAAVGR